MDRQRPYPTRGGLPIHPRELDIPSTLYTGLENNHHHCFTLARMSNFLVTQTLRDLEAYQTVMDVAQHNWLHDRFSQPTLSLNSAYDRVHEAYDDGELLRLGSAKHYQLVPIDDRRIAAIDDEWRERLL